MSVMRVIVLHPCTKFRIYGAFSVSALIGLLTLIFDLLTPKWGHSHPCYELPAVNFQLATPFRSRRRVRHGTDRQTDRQRSSLHNAPTLGGGGRGQNNNNNNVKSSRFNNAMR